MTGTSLFFRDNGMDRTVQGGFTVIELMIVVAIAAIVSLFAIPEMKDLITNQRVRAAVTDFHLSMLMARSEAIKRNTDVVMTPNSGDWKNGWVVTTTQSGSTITLRNGDALNSKLTIECNTDANTAADTCPANVTFERTGRPTSLIEFRIYEASNPRVFMRCVSVSLSGLPDIKIDDDLDTSNGCGN